MGAQWKHAGRVAQGAAKGALFTKLAKEIIVAAKNGDPSPEHNARLRAAIEAARKNSMPRDTIERCIKKGAGLLEPVNYDTVLYEGYAPNQVPVIVECLTDNKNRTASEVRVLFRKGQLGTSVMWMYDRVGVIEGSHPSGMDPEEAAIEAGAQDLEAGEESTTFYTNPTDLAAVNAALAGMGWVVSTMELAYRCKNPVDMADGPEKDEVIAFISAIDENDDVHRVHVGLK
ncbi:MAG: YebC/PmpR family DNA-binding transcriptional regulator [Deltaproteobacteria bacterium]|nr:YebC/PmpR family DNA-binding transcriptional regulator [Deltaproteobacteria bacterium]